MTPELRERIERILRNGKLTTAEVREAQAALDVAEDVTWCDTWEGLVTHCDGAWELWVRGTRFAHAPTLPAAVAAVKARMEGGAR